jgi:FkbM family methyltransferase
MSLQLNPDELIRSAARRVVPAQMRSRIKQYLRMPATRLHPDWSLLARIGPCEQDHVVVDAGAHHGWFFHCWLDWCPRATVHAFEPYPESAATIARLYGNDPRVHVVEAALGESDGHQQLKVFGQSSASNSLLRPRPSAWNDIHFATGEISVAEVPTTTIDSYAERRHIDGIHLLKIDVQGYELKVLRGAARMLPAPGYVFVESAIQQLYDGAPRFTEVIDFLVERGFHLIGLRTWHPGNFTLIEADMLFRRNDLAPTTKAAKRIFE